MTATPIVSLINETETLMRQVVDDAEQDAAHFVTPKDLTVYDLARYHLGWVDNDFRPTQSDPGKRIRPTICLLSAGAAGTEAARAVPVAAAIELLHNFTLMHDDIQDRSELRRGRPTVWTLWGESQAINAGDATFALAQLALFRLSGRGLDPEIVSDLFAEFNRMTLRIVEGQVLDLGFEERWDITADDYIRMISGKTAAIVAFAAWAGARIAGTDAERSNAFREFGRLLGLGFQVRDDYLGIWGDSSDTGKDRGDDIRGRKKSIPIILLLEAVSREEAAELQAIYQTAEPGPSQVDRVIELLDAYAVDEQVQRLTTDYHHQALELLEKIAQASAYRDALQGLAERLVDRDR